MILAVIIIASVLTYLVAAAYIGGLVSAGFKHYCGRCRSNRLVVVRYEQARAKGEYAYPPRNDCFESHNWQAAGALWPFVLVIAVAFVLGFLVVKLAILLGRTPAKAVAALWKKPLSLGESYFIRRDARKEVSR